MRKISMQECRQHRRIHTEKVPHIILQPSLRKKGLQRFWIRQSRRPGVSSVIPEETGLEVVTRVSDTTRFYFVMNFTDEEQILPESLTGKKDMISQKMTEHGMKLKKWDVLLLEEHL